MNALTPNVIAVPTALTRAASAAPLTFAMMPTPFGSCAAAVAAHGWSIFPQDGSTRRPGLLDGRAICPKSAEHVDERQVDEKTLASWIAGCGRDNIAVMFGPAMPGLFAVDVDVLDERMSWKISDLAEEHLGPTPFMRVGRAPKIALLYRVAAGETVPSRAYQLTAGGEDSANALEILGAGKTLTIVGTHHKTGMPYAWIGSGMPLTEGPMSAPEVGADQVTAFLAAVDAEFVFAKAAAWAEGRWAEGDAGRVRVATVERLEGAPLAKDGREELLRGLAFRTARLNGGAFVAAAPGEELDALIRDVAAAVVDAFSAVAERDGRWAPAALRAAAGAKIAALAGKIRAGEITAPRGQGVVVGADGTPRALPIIRLSEGDQTPAMDAASAALVAAGLGVYQRGGAYVEAGAFEIMTASGLATGSQRIFPINENRMLEKIRQAAYFERWNAKKEEARQVTPLLDFARSIMSRPGCMPVPVLAGVIGAPTLRADGSILSEPGYDAATGLLLDTRGAVFPEIPENPTKDDAAKALQFLSGLIDTFPFVGRDDKAIALACLLTACIRRSLETAPMFAFSAPVAGSGKSTLVDLACILATGREAGVLAQGSTDEEDEKRLGAALLAGDAVISWDNCTRPVGGPLFCQLLTQQVVKPRTLGASKITEVPTSVLVCGTANNFIFLADMTRRGLLSTLDPGCERPELRVFASDPVAEAKAHRGEYVVAALTVLRAYRLAKAPEQGGSALLSFVHWSRWVRDALRWLGEGDACGTMELARSLDPQLDALSCVMSQWQECLGANRVTASEVVAFACQQDESAGRGVFTRPDFREALLAIARDSGFVSSRRLGIWLSAHHGRLVDGCKIVRDGMGHGRQVWRMELSPGLQAEAAEAEKAAHAKEAARATGVARQVLAYALPIFGGNEDAAMAWLERPSVALGGTAFEIAGTELGMKRVQVALVALGKLKAGPTRLPLKPAQT